MIDQIDMMGEDELRAALRDELARIEKLRNSLNRMFNAACSLTIESQYDADLMQTWVDRAQGVNNARKAYDRIYEGGE